MTLSRFVALSISLVLKASLLQREAGILAATFVWTDATPTDYENWSAGEPNDWQNGVAKCDGTGNEDCTEVIQNRCRREFVDHRYLTATLP